MASYWVGTSGYAYKEWRGPFYPDDLTDNEMLRFYARHLATVELNHTFYRPITVRQLHAWAKETPDSFAFSLKAPRRITYDMRLRDTADLVSDFFETVRSLKQKLGAVLFQIPPFLKRDVPRLEDFLHQMPSGCRAAFEFRNQSWLNDEVYECLRRFGVALCAVEGPERNVPPEPTADFGYFRLRRPAYSEDDLADLARRIQDAGAGWTDVYAYFKHEADGAGPSYAARLGLLLNGGATTVAAGL
jgi:uncharacterized protein YecE (DUF72 family)